MLPDLVKNLRSLVAFSMPRQTAPSVDVETILRPSHQKRRLAITDWKVLSESQRQRVRLAVFYLINEGVAGTKQSTSTNGNLTVLHHPDAGKKLGSRRQPRADRTVTQNKKRKL